MYVQFLDQSWPNTVTSACQGCIPSSSEERGNGVPRWESGTSPDQDYRGLSQKGGSTERSSRRHPWQTRLLVFLAFYPKFSSFPLFVYVSPTSAPHIPIFLLALWLRYSEPLFFFLFIFSSFLLFLSLLHTHASILLGFASQDFWLCSLTAVNYGYFH